MTRNRMPGHNGAGNEAPLSQKLALAMVKRWVQARVKDAQEGRVTMNRQTVSRLLWLLSGLLGALSAAVGAADWSQVAQWASQNGPEMIAAVGSLVAALIAAFIRKPKEKLPQ